MYLCIEMKRPISKVINIVNSATLAKYNVVERTGPPQVINDVERSGSPQVISGGRCSVGKLGISVRPSGENTIVNADAQNLRFRGKLITACHILEPGCAPSAIR